MTCYLIANGAGIDIHQDEAPTLVKTICILGDALLLPALALISGVIGTFFLIIKTLSIFIVHTINSFRHLSQPSLAKRFSCLAEDLFMPHLAPILLLPILGITIYLGLLIQSFSKQFGQGSFLDAATLSVSAPASLIVESITSWKLSPREFAPD